MEKEKRNRVRAIIFVDGKIVSMYREYLDRIYYTFPGGGMNADETEEDCVKREVFEEFGLIVKPTKKVYIYENEISIEHFYICDWISGEFGTGHGEEFMASNKNGIYKPCMIEISKIPELPLMPPEIASVFYDDYLKNGKELRNDVKVIKIKE